MYMPVNSDYVVPAPFPLTTRRAGRTALKRPVQVQVPSSRPAQEQPQEAGDRWTPPSPAAHLASVRCGESRSSRTYVGSAAQAESSLTGASNDRWQPPSPAAHFASARCEAQRSVDPIV